MISRQIEIFHAAMTCSSLMEAADKLHLSQPAVSISIKQLEDKLGFDLFHRGGGRLTPTPEALELMHEAGRLHDSVETFKRLANQLNDDLTSHIRIAAPPALGHDMMPDILEGFIKSKPKVELELSTQHHNDLMKELRASASEYAFGLYFGEIDHSGITSRKIANIPIVAICPASWRIGASQTVNENLLRIKPQIGTFSGEPLGNLLKKLRQKWDIDDETILKVHSHDIAANLVSRGLGMAIIDNLTARHAVNRFGQDKVTLHALSDPQTISLSIAYPTKRPLNRTAGKIITLIEKWVHEYQQAN